MSRKRLKKIHLRSKINDSTSSNECANYCHKLFEPEEKLKNCVELPNNIKLIGEKLKTSQVEEAMKTYLKNQNIKINILSAFINKKIYIPLHMLVLIKQTIHLFFFFAIKTNY